MIRRSSKQSFFVIGKSRLKIETYHSSHSGRTENVVFSWVDDPRQFFLLLSSRVEDISSIEQELHQIYAPLGPSQKRLAAFEPGTICVAK